MRTWLAAAVPALHEVSDRPTVWIVGGLAWAATAGPLALFAAVVPMPTAADLTHLAARAFVASAWPWNAITLGAITLAVVLIALLLVTIADLTLVARGRPQRDAIAAAYAVTTIAAAMVALPVVVGALAIAAVAPREFTAPDSGGAGPVLRTAASVAPLVAVVGVTVTVAAAWAARGRVLIVATGRGVGAAVEAVRGTGSASLIHTGATALAWCIYLAVAVLLLGVLWAPIGEQLAGGAGFGAAQAALLVGFVAIWLCLVLGGGALHAWGVASWMRILALRSPPVGRGRPQPEETPSTP